MQALRQLVSFDLAIPVWHIVLYVACVSFLMIERRLKFAIVASYVVALYWLHYAFHADLVTSMNGDNLARTVYYVFGFAFVLLGIYAIFFLGDEEAEFQLEKNKKELAGLRSKAKEARKRANELKSQLKLEQTQESSSRSDLEEKLNARIDELERQVAEGVGVLEKRDAQVTELQTSSRAAEEDAAALRAQLQTDQTRNSAFRTNLEDELNAKIDSLERQLREGESRIETGHTEIAELRARAQAAEETAASMRAQLENAPDGDAVTRVHAESELKAEIQKLQIQLEDAESLLAIRKTKIDELKVDVRDAEKNAADLKAQLETVQSKDSATEDMPDAKFSAKLDKLKQQLKEAEGLLEARNTELIAIRTKASEADKKAAALKAQLEKDQSRESAARNKLQEDFTGKIAKLERRLKEGESLLEKRDAEIAELTTKTHDAAKNAAALKAQLESDRSKEADAKGQVEEELNGKIDKLEHQLREGGELIQKRDAEIAEMQARARQAEDTAAALKARLERDQSEESASRNKLQEELNAKVGKLEHQLQEGHKLLEQRNAEIAELQSTSQQAEERAAALKARLEKDQSEESASKNKLQEELNAKVGKLEHQLQEGHKLLEQRDAEIAELQTKSQEAEENASVFKAKLEKEQSKEAAARKMLEEELNDKINKLEHRLKEGESLLEKRDAEITELTHKTRVAEKAAGDAQTRLKKDQVHEATAKKQLEEELNAKIGKLEGQLQDGETLLKKRDAEIAELRAKTTGADKKTAPLKSPAALNRQGAQPQVADDKDTLEDDVRKKLHQFQYAVKFLEDQLKEKDRLMGLMVKKNAQAPAANNKNAVDEDLKKKVHQLEQTVKYFETQVKEKDGLLSLMAKRNRELAELKTKAEERLETSGPVINDAQMGNGNK